MDQLKLIQDSKESAYKQLVAVYDRMLLIQNQIIDKLEKQLNAKPSTFKKIMRVVKEVLILSAGITIGRGL